MLRHEAFLLTAIILVTEDALCLSLTKSRPVLTKFGTLKQLRVIATLNPINTVTQEHHTVNSFSQVIYILPYPIKLNA